jgi:carbon storage regulator CsrA
MLVLRRARGEAVTIGKNADTIIKILSCENGIVCLGIDADRDIQIDRLEVFEKRLHTLPPEDSTRSTLLRRLRLYAKNITQSFARITR